MRINTILADLLQSELEARGVNSLQSVDLEAVGERHIELIRELELMLPRSKHKGGFIEVVIAGLDRHER
jgi:hypothetical protein